MKRATILGLAVLLVTVAAWAQQPGPMQAPINPPVIKRIPLFPQVPPPPMGRGQIIEHFVSNETLYKAAYEKYGFQETIRVEELGSGGGPTGTFQVQTEVYPRPGGKTYVRVLKKGQSSLQVLSLAAPDLETIAQIPPFPLAGSASADYKFTYRGTQKQGDLMTYAFEVEPKGMQPGHYYFSGLVWVDKVDLAIVKSYGHFVTSGPKPTGTLPFTSSFFVTYRENVAGKYWFPSYIRADSDYREGRNELPIQLVIRSRDFHTGGPKFPVAKTKTTH